MSIETTGKIDGLIWLWLIININKGGTLKMNKEMSKESKEQLAEPFFEMIKKIIKNAEKKLAIIYPIEAARIKTVTLTENLTTFVYETQNWLQKCEIKNHDEEGKKITICFKKADSLSADFESSGYEASIMCDNEIIFYAKKDDDPEFFDKQSLKVILGEREGRIYQVIKKISDSL